MAKDKTSISRQRTIEKIVTGGGCMKERIVITGMGTINPIGHTVQESWENVIAGVSGVRPIKLFDASHLLVQIACEVKDFHPEKYLDPREVRRRDRFEQLAAVAVEEAIRQSGLEPEKEDSHRIGVVISAAIGGLNTVTEMANTLRESGPRRVNPFSIPMLMANGSAGLAGIDHGLHGPSFSVASACSSGSDGIGMAWLMLKAGVIDAAVAGASEATISEMGIAAFDRVGALSRRNDNYDSTPAPFDLNRDGLVMGEGAGVLVLETETHARKRGAVILAELAGYGASADGFHLTAPLEDGSEGTRAILTALKYAGVNAEEVGYINAHGTATELNDLSETRAIKGAFGELAYRIPVSSTKSMTGHMMGATGAVEAIFCVEAIRSGCLPPTIHYQTPDPRCDLDYIPNQAREAKIRVAVSNAFGFGGHNAVLVLKAYD
jgi:3-oxoacyl-[acyl-carrier-protein] synthase II